MAQTRKTTGAAPAREPLATRRRTSATDLLERRTDLVGVSSLADLMRDSVRWAA